MERGAEIGVLVTVATRSVAREHRPSPSIRRAVPTTGQLLREGQCRRARPPDCSRCGCDSPWPGVSRARCRRRRVSTDDAIQLAVVLGLSSPRLRRLRARRRSRCGSRRHGMALTSRRSVDPRRCCSVLRGLGGCWHPRLVALRSLVLGLQSRASSEPVAVGVDSQPAGPRRLAAGCDTESTGCSADGPPEPDSGPRRDRNHQLRPLSGAVSVRVSWSTASISSVR